jgi:hypothetical protein
MVAALVLSGGAAFESGVESVVAEELEQNLYLCDFNLSIFGPFHS